MRFWDVSGAEVEAADDEPWDMPMAAAVRPFQVQALVRLFLAGSFLFGSSGLSGLGYALATRDETAHPTSFVLFNAVAIGLALAVVIWLLIAPPRLVRRAAPVLALAILTTAPVLVTWGLGSAGPGFAVVAIAYIQAPLFSFYVLRRPWAAAEAGLVLLCSGVLLAGQDGWLASPWAWLFVAANVIGTGVIMGQIAARADELASSERRARSALTELNRTLEQRVVDQVTEIERLGALRRFLSPQVADVVLAGGSSDALTTAHRAKIAVLFCDLRGFTAFTNRAEPEEVIGVLEEYYKAVGALLLRYDATIGAYAGDGIMGYLGDPVPREDAAVVAVQMCRELPAVLAPVVHGWHHRGYDLHYGVGLAYGYATLGVVGFDGRFDYTPIGAVVNLAARLCAQAERGQVLLDHAVFAEADDRFPMTPVPALELKGYDDEKRAYRLD